MELGVKTLSPSDSSLRREPRAINNRPYKKTIVRLLVR